MENSKTSLNKSTFYAFGAGIIIGLGFHRGIRYLSDKYFSNQKYNTTTAIDHVVLRSRNKTDACKRFYRLLGFDIEREEAAKKYEQNKSGSVVFPIVRINSKQAIDLFPDYTQFVWCKETQGIVDHICLTMSADEHLAALKRLKNGGIVCVKQFRAFGAQGYGWATYFHDPTGLYIEIRNYEQARWAQVEQFAKTMIKSLVVD